MNKTQCANVQILFSPALDSRLEPAELMVFETHLRDCDSCEGEYEQYTRLFIAIASLPGSTMQGPAPFPNTVKSFRGSEQSNIPWWGRFGTTAAAAVLLAIVGFGAFQAGRRDDIQENPEGEEVGEVEFVQPTEPVTRQLKGWHHELEGLPFLFEAASHSPSKQVQQVLATICASTAKETRRLMAMDRTSLGSLERQTKQIAQDVIFYLDDVEDQNRRINQPAKFIHFAKNRFHDERMVDRRSELSFMVRGFAGNDGAQITWRKTDSVAQDLGLAARWFVKGNSKKSRIHLNHSKRGLLNKPSTQLYQWIGELERVFVPTSAGLGHRGQRRVISITLQPSVNGSLMSPDGLGLRETSGEGAAVIFSIHESQPHSGGKILDLKPASPRRLQKWKSIAPKVRKFEVLVKKRRSRLKTL